MNVQEKKTGDRLRSYNSFYLSPHTNIWSNNRVEQQRENIEGLSSYINRMCMRRHRLCDHNIFLSLSECDKPPLYE